MENQNLSNRITESNRNQNQRQPTKKKLGKITPDICTYVVVYIFTSDSLDTRHHHTASSESN